MKPLIVSTFIILLVIASCKNSPNPENYEFPEAPEGLRINQVQVLGTHNSYAKPIDPNALEMADSVFAMMGDLTQHMSEEQLATYREYHPYDMTLSEALSYSHPPLSVQLDSGMRNLEIDVYHDPTGNRFNDPAVYRELREKGFHDLAPFDSLSLTDPGFKVLHMADFDFRTHCSTLEACLLGIKDWSDRNPKHVPISIMIEIKHNPTPFFGEGAEVLPFDKAAFDALDEEIISVMGIDRLITPDIVRGKFSSLEEAVLANNWPLLDSCRGKFMFLMISALDPKDTNPYLKGHESLKDRVMFIRSMPGQPHAAFLLIDNSIVRFEQIQNWVKQGYFVRTRSDIETWEAKHEDYTRAIKALESGAQVVSTDYFMEGNNYNTDYVVRLPGGSVCRVNPVNLEK